MDIVTGVALIAIAMTASITIGYMHNKRCDMQENLASLALKREQLDKQRNVDQQTAEVERASAQGYSRGLEHTSTVVRQTIDALKAPQIVVAGR